ncbi:MAG: hypothetical protein E5X28_09455, partial [Mesorhizobium sp.]
MPLPKPLPLFPFPIPTLALSLMRVCAVRTTVPNSPTASHGDDCMGSPTATWSVVDVSPGIVAPR